MKRFIASGIFGLSLLANSANSEISFDNKGAVQNRLNINIPKDLVKVEDVTTLLNFLSSSIHEGKTEVSLADALANVEIPADYQALVAKVLASRDPLASVECAGRKCKITSKGTALDFKIDGVNIPILGTPTIFLAKNIAIYAQVSEDNLSAEICRVEGIAVKISLLKPKIDGGMIEIQDGEIKTLLIDAGSGGTFPTNNCDFVSASDSADQSL